MKLIDKNGIKFKTHNFVSRLLDPKLMYICNSMQCLECRYCIYHPFNSDKLCDDLFLAINLQFSVNLKDYWFEDIPVSCDENIIRNIIK